MTRTGSQAPALLACAAGGSGAKVSVSSNVVNSFRRTLLGCALGLSALLPCPGAIVINEIHYNPDVKTDAVEFVELYNAGTNAVNLAGWTLRGGAGLQYIFPSTNIPPGGYVVVGQNPAAVQTKYAVTRVLGPFNVSLASALSKYGDSLELRTLAGAVEDEVQYGVGFPWPTVGDPPGYSIELIHPALDNSLGGSWRSAIGPGGTHGPTPGRVNSVFATNAPPQSRQVEHHPSQPVSGQAVTLTAKVTDPDGVASVILQYQVVLPGSYIELTDAAYSSPANWITLAMADDGTGGDSAAGDAVYTAVIPASVQAHRRLVRYRLVVTDRLGNSVRVPYADDPQPNFAYFVYDGVPGWSGAIQPGAGGANGVVQTYSSNVMGRLPAYHLIARSNTVATATWFSRYGGDVYQWAGTLVYDGKVYDHIHYRARGGVWRYSMCKNMWKFDMNRGHDFQPRDNWGRRYGTPWTKLNLGASIQQGDFNHRGEQGMFESLGFRMFQLAGVAAPNTTYVTFRVIDEAQEASPASQYEGDFWGVYLAIEQEDSRFLEEHGLPDGNFYKMEGGTGTLNSLGAAGPANGSDLSLFLNTYNSTTNGSLPDSWWRTNLNLPRLYGYQTVVQSIHHYDIADGKNYFYFNNPITRQWEVCTWDLDLTWADNMYRGGQQGGDEPFKSRVLSNFASPGSRPVLSTEFRNFVREWRDLFWNSDQAYTLIDEYASLLRGPTNGATILDADRMMWDYNPKMISGTYSDNPGSKAGQGRYYQFPNEATVPKNFNGTLQLLKDYVNYRGANTTFSLDTVATDPARPARPTLTYTGPTNHPLNRLTLHSSAYSGAAAFASLRWRLGEVTDLSSPAYNPAEPRKYEVETVWDSGPITPFSANITLPADRLRAGSRYRVRVQHTDINGRASNWSLPHEFTCGETDGAADLLSFLRITEILYNPAPGGFEYVELFNASSTVTLDLAGVKFTQGIDFTCPSGTLLPPGAYLLVIGTTNVAAFRSYHGLDGSAAILSAFNGSLNNAGEQLVLRTSAGGSDIVHLVYGDGRGWPVQADGPGHSLVLLDSAVASEGSGSGSYAGNWRASPFLRGSPGRGEAQTRAEILLNEIVANTPPGAGFDSNDWIELYNPAEVPFTFGPGWFLSDDGSGYTNLMKWQIPPGTTVPARGFVTFDENTAFHFPTNTGFGLNQAGEQVFLSHLPGDSQDRVVDAVSFKGQENGWSLGRFPDGGPFWHGLTPPTRSSRNASPALHVALTEILFHPPELLVGTNRIDNSRDEFVEVFNPLTLALPLANTNGGWRLNGGIGFPFPTDTLLAPGEHLLVAGFDPSTNATELASFRARYGVPASVRILGPFAGKLANDTDRVALERPQAGNAPGETPNWVVVDEVIYSDQSPWPCRTDGEGSSLQRLSLVGHGSDPANWTAQIPSAGQPRPALPAVLPAITTQPRDRIVATRSAATFSVAACGTPPFSYQWQFNGQDLPAATNDTLVILQALPGDAGSYRALVSNAAGTVPSDSATLLVQFPPQIDAPPVPATVVRDQSATFTVAASGSAPLSYQWQFNGANLTGATNQTLLLNSVQAVQAGAYRAIVLNTAGAVASAEAVLTVLIPATITVPPTNRLQQVTFNPATLLYNPTNVSFNASAVGIGTLRYQWKLNGTALPGATAPSLSVANVTPREEGEYTVTVSDTIGSSSASATLTVVVPPVFVIRPTSQSAIAGASVTFNAQVITHPPPITNEWRKGSTGLQTNLSFDGITFFTLTNISTNSTGNYNVVVRTRAFPSGLAGGTGVLTVLADSDEDGLPDAWEALYFGGTNAAAAGLDSDGDTVSNAAEYLAGTDPTDPLSYLKVDRLQRDAISNQLMRIEFLAVSNRAYTVQSSDRPSGGSWAKVQDVLAVGTNRPVVLTDPLPAGAAPRYYRLRTPRIP